MASSKDSGPLYLVILIVFAAIVIGTLSSEEEDVRKLDSRQFQKAVEERTFAVDPAQGWPAAATGEDLTAASPRESQAGSPSSGSGGPEMKAGPLTIHDESQKVTGLLEPKGGASYSSSSTLTPKATI